MHSSIRSLTAVLEAARVAVLHANQSRPVTSSSAPDSAAIQPAELPALPRITYTRVELPHQFRAGLTLPSVATLTASHELTPAAVRVFDLLHRIAAHVVKAKAYPVVPDQVVFHLPASMLRVGVGMARSTLYRHLPALVEVGLLAFGGQAATVNNMRLYGGCLWAVKLKPGTSRARLRAEDWTGKHRDFEDDMREGRTAAAWLESVGQLQSDERESACLTALKAWALVPGNVKSPLSVGVRADAPANLAELSHALTDLVHVHPARRAEQVGTLASGLARALDDRHSRRWYCGLLWRALEGEQEGRAGLQVLAAALARLDADRAEWGALRNPAALLAHRLTG